MTLGAGTRLGVYEIAAEIGAGGMGVVYRARDTKLGRDVALKVIPDAFALDPDRLARFKREAQVLASLNHPNIAAIYGFEEGPEDVGAAFSRPLQALVLELVEGPTLADRIAHGPIPVDEALPIARQIAEALEAAHERGIAHRDLKPANIKLRSDGTVKVLDFGLAKALGPAEAGPHVPSQLSVSPTITSPALMTGVGVFLGTAAYMAPEQARGTVVDKRADIWAFGVLVFEMLTGKRLFEGETVSDMLASVLRQEIDWNGLPPDTPRSIVNLLRRCLEREPKRRLRDIGEARIVLESASGSGRLQPSDGPPEREGHGHQVLRYALASLGAIGLVAAILVSAWQWWRTPSAMDGAVLRLSAPLPSDVSFDLANRPVVAVSRDGSKVAIVGNKKDVNQLYLRPLGEFDARPLPGTEGASGPFFSPDGSWLGFFADGKLKKIPSGGGPVITLADAPDPRGAVWTDRDTIIMEADTITPLVELPAAGGAGRALSTIDSGKHERTHRWPSLLPDGRTVLFTVGSVEHPDDYDDGTIEAIRTDTGERRLVFKGGRMSRYLPTGDLLFLRGKILYAVPFDPKRLEVSGSPRPVVDGVSGDTTTGAAHYSVSDNGTLVYVQGDPSGAARRLAWVDKQGKPMFLDVPVALYADPHVSPDGRRIAVSIIDATNSSRDVWIIDTVRGTSSRMTFGGINRTPIWSRDGSRTYYVTYDTRRNKSIIVVKAADGTGDVTTIREIPGQAYLEGLTPDETVLTLGVTNPTVGGTTRERATVFRLSVKGGEPEEIVHSPGNSGFSALSPDGRWLTYASGESGRNEVYVQAFASGGNRSQVSTSGGTEPRWAPDGRTLYYRQNSQLMMVPVESGAAFVPGKTTMLFGGIAAIFVDSGQTYGVAPAGDRFVMMRPSEGLGSIAEVRILLNWFTDLRAATLAR